MARLRDALHELLEPAPYAFAVDPELKRPILLGLLDDPIALAEHLMILPRCNPGDLLGKLFEVVSDGLQTGELAKECALLALDVGCEALLEDVQLGELGHL